MCFRCYVYYLLPIQSGCSLPLQQQEFWNLSSGDQINASSGGSNGAGQADPFMYTQRVAPEETMNDADRAATAQSATFATKNGTKLITSALQGIDTKCLLSGTVELPASRLTDERSMGTFGGQELGV